MVYETEVRREVLENDGREEKEEVGVGWCGVLKCGKWINFGSCLKEKFNPLQQLVRNSP